ncbi:MAG: hypothetical protein HY347_12305 [candidate division NC10 bacterium]|nr:hypothetical protein [candidate division NC10 bacterium]
MAGNPRGYKGAKQRKEKARKAWQEEKRRRKREQRKEGQGMDDQAQKPAGDKAILPVPTDEPSTL